MNRLPHRRLRGLLPLILALSGSVAVAQPPIPPAPTGPSTAAAPTPSQAAQAAQAPTSAQAAPASASLAFLDVGREGGITADQAARMALDSSPSIDAARANTAAARAAANDAFARMLPDVQAQFQVTHLGRLGANAPLETGVQDPDATQAAITATADPNAQYALQSMFNQIETASNTPTPMPIARYSLDGQATYPVLAALIAGIPAYRAAGLDREASQIRESTEEQTVVQEARETYYQYGRALAAVEIARQQVESSRANLEQLRVSVRAGAALQADLAQLEAELASYEVQLATAQGDAAQAKIELETFITRGDPTGHEVVFGEDLSAPVPGPDGTVEQLVEEALGHRTELAMLRAQVAAAHQNVRAAGRSRLPELSATFGGTYANPNMIYFPWDSVWRGNWRVGATLSWSFQQFMRQQTGMRRHDARLSQLLAQEEQLLDGVRTEVVGTRARLDAAQQAYDAALTGVRAASEAYEVKRTQLRLGAAVVNDVTQAQTRLTRAQLQLVDAAIELRVERVRLDRALGRYAAPAGAEADGAPEADAPAGGATGQP